MSGVTAAGTALVGGRVALLLGDGLNTLFVRRLKDAVFAQDPVDAVFHVLSEAGLRNLPSFACVIRDDIGIRLLLRGSVAAYVRTFGGDERTIEGEAVSTWAEHVIRDPREVTLRSSARNRDQSNLVLLFDERDQKARGRRRRDDDRSSRRSEAETGSSLPLERSAPPPATPAPVIDEALGGPSARPARRAEPAPRPEAPQGRPSVAPIDPGSHSPARGPRARHADDGEPTIVPWPEPETVGTGDWAEPVPTTGRGSRDDADFDFSHLLEQTKYKGVEAAAMREPVHEHAAARWDAPSPGLIDGVPSRPVSARSPAQGDHDGDTVSARGLRPEVMAPRQPAALLRPIVQAVRCGRGHANPPFAERCTSCGAAVVDRAIVQVERPVLGRLRFSDGLVVDLDRPLVVGRKPDHNAVGQIGGEDPGLVALPDPERALSRVHAEIRLEDWHVVVVDRRSANGTIVEIPGEEAMQLHPDQPCLITGGTRVTLADAVSFTFELPTS